MIINQTIKIKYDATGTQKVWDIPFPFIDESTIRAVAIDPTGLEYPVLSNFEISEIAKDKFQYTYPVLGDPLAVGWQIMIYRSTPIIQGTDLINSGNFHADVIESMVDKVTMVLQETHDLASRAVTLPITESVDWNTLVQQLFEAAVRAENGAARVEAGVALLSVVSADSDGLMPKFENVVDGAMPEISNGQVIWRNRLTISNVAPTEPGQIGDIWFQTLGSA